MIRLLLVEIKGKKILNCKTEDGSKRLGDCEHAAVLEDMRVHRVII